MNSSNSARRAALRSWGLYLLALTAWAAFICVCAFLGVIVCAVAAPLCRRLLAMVIVYMAMSLLMAVLWSLLQSPDLAITEAAVGAGVTSILFFLTLKRIHALKGTKDG